MLGCGFAIGELSSSSERQEYEFCSGVGRLECAELGCCSLLSGLVTEDVVVAVQVELGVPNNAH